MSSVYFDPELSDEEGSGIDPEFAVRLKLAGFLLGIVQIQAYLADAAINLKRLATALLAPILRWPARDRTPKPNPTTSEKRSSAFVQRDA